MGSGNTTTSGQPAATNTGLANAFMSNQPLSQTYTPMTGIPSTAPSTFSQLSATGALPGLTGSLIGSGSMPALPKPAGPMPIPLPVAAAAPSAAKISPHVNGAYMQNFPSSGNAKITDEMKKGYYLPGGPRFAGGR